MTNHTPNLEIDLTGEGVLTEFSNELYNGTITIFQPLIAGKEIFKKMRRANVFRTLDFITDIPKKSQEELIDAFTDIVAIEEITEKTDTKTKLREQLINAVKDKNIQAKLEFADKYFKNLSNSDKKQIYRLTMIRTLGVVSTLRNAINYGLWEKKSNIKELMIVDQVLYKIEDILTKDLHNMKHVDRDLNYCVFLMLRLEAFRRKKIDLEKLEHTLSYEMLLPSYRLPNVGIINPSDYGTILKVLGA